MSSIGFNANLINLDTTSTNVSNEPKKSKISGLFRKKVKDPSQVAKNKEHKQIDKFSITGYLSDEFLKICHTMNPAHALFNCPVIGYMTAFLLEKGKVPHMKLFSRNRPRPMAVKDLIETWPELFTTLGDNRGYIHMHKCSKSMLDMLMSTLGAGTHAIVGGDGKGVLGFMKGHIWNYVFDEHGKFSIIDSYSKSKYKKGLEDPEKFFNNYNINDLEVIIFYEKNRVNNEVLFGKPSDPAFNRE